MKQFDDMKKKMPYVESKDYLERLIRQAADKAVDGQRAPQAKGRHGHVLLRYLHPVMAAAAIVLVMVALGLRYFQPQDEQSLLAEQELTTATKGEDATDGPVDDFLATLTDEEVQLLAYYDIDEIPEY